jgi:hypothetical protein
MDKTNLTRFLISDLKRELSENRVAAGRHGEYIRFFIEHLGDDQCYCLSDSNPDRPKEFIYTGGKPSRTYLAGGISLYFVKATVVINGQTLPAIIQKIYPKTAGDFRRLEDYTVYLSKNAVDNL